MLLTAIRIEPGTFATQNSRAKQQATVMQNQTHKSHKLIAVIKYM
jgi:hypothetical protein